MIKGLYAAASAMLANLYRHGLLAHNIANVDTPGFKQVLTSLDDFKETSVIYPPGPTAGLADLRWVGDIGLGVQTSSEITDFLQGGLRNTGHPFDLAIQGEGFFRIQTPDGERYTRDGRFYRDVDGNLVTVDGYQVLDDGGQPINLPEGEFSVSPEGNLLVNGQIVATLGLAAFEDPSSELTRDGSNYFAAEGGPTSDAVGTVAQGYLEMSNANPAQLMTQMIAVARAYEAAQKMVQTQDELLGKAISSLGTF
ncbi:MAG: flagellar basal-body rod protein FlgF [Anaerolineales bacterium]